MHTAMMIAFSRPASAEQEAEYNNWYSNIHLPEVMKIKGVIGARRYKTADIKPPEGISGRTHPYVAIYELSATNEAELEMVMNALDATMQAGGFTLTDTMDDTGSAATMALPIGKPLPA